MKATELNRTPEALYWGTFRVRQFLFVFFCLTCWHDAVFKRFSVPLFLELSDARHGADLASTPSAEFLPQPIGEKPFREGVPDAEQDACRLVFSILPEKWYICGWRSKKLSEEEEMSSCSKENVVVPLSTAVFSQPLVSPNANHFADPDVIGKI